MLTDEQGQDGMVHLTYFDKAHQLSFTWDGSQDGWIDVSVGGYAEPYIARIFWKLPTLNTSMGLMLDSFKARCDTFIAEIYAFTDA